MSKPFTKFIATATLSLGLMFPFFISAHETDTSYLTKIEERYGTQVDVDGAFGGQCWDLTNYYLQAMGSKGIWGGSGRAGWIGHEYYDKLTSEGFTVSLDPKLSELQAGDIVNLRPGANYTDSYYGHTIIIKSVNEDGTFTTIEQNSEKGQIVAEYTRTFVEGAVTSKVAKLKPEPKPQPRKITSEDIRKFNFADLDLSPLG